MARVSPRNRSRNQQRQQSIRQQSLRQQRRSTFEQLERREVFSGTPLPVLLVIADQQDFFYQEYGDTYNSLVARDVDVVVAARTTNPSVAHAGTGQGAGSGIVVPDIALADVDAADYSAITFVGGWGASMYQYAFPGDYDNNAYDGDAATKEVVNNLINDFIEQDKYVAGVCNGVTVLAWARVDGVSPLAGRTVAVPYIGSAAATYEGVYYGNYGWAQPQQMDDNGINYFPSGSIGVADDPSDDVWVDGQFITGENNFSAAEFGDVIADYVIAAAVEDELPPPPPPPSANNAPLVSPGNLQVAENSAAGTVVGQVVASDSDAGQALTFAIVGGNASGAFAIDAVTGVITVASTAALNFETSPVFDLLIEATDNGLPAMSGTAQVTVDLLDVFEPPPGPISHDGPNVLVQGTSGADTIYIWTNHTGQQFVWLNGLQVGPMTMEPGGRVIVYGGDGNDQIFATDNALPVTIFGQGGHDLITGGSASDKIDGGDGWDRICAGPGDDLIFGGAGTDQIDGRQGNDVILGGDGDDYLYGGAGLDILIGNTGGDRVDGGDGDDLLIGGSTSFDNNNAALQSLLAEWTAPGPRSSRITVTGTGGTFTLSFNGQTTGVVDDGVKDTLLSGAGDDWLLLQALDCHYGSQASDQLFSA